jgi:hypothetical protein
MKRNEARYEGKLHPSMFEFQGASHESIKNHN